jgi:tetrapyrrole methylase family protein / MazG family protein
MPGKSEADQHLVHLLNIVRKLRSPEGCLWDREQKPEHVARYLLEEAYEVVDAVEMGSAPAIREELGDLLFQIIFLARIAEEREDFDFVDVITAAGKKMVRRHPHVFGDAKVESVADIKGNWDIIKKMEKGGYSYRERFEGITKALPALLRAQKITQEAAKAGFDWGKTEDVFEKVEEELEELKDAIKTNRRERINEEIGDILFSLVNLCRFLDVNAEESLRGASQKFVRRFSSIEDELIKEGRNPAETPLSELDRLWEEAKQKERIE